MEFATETCGLTEDLLKKVAHMIVEADGVCFYPNLCHRLAKVRVSEDGAMLEDSF